jgi:hypothetical protein
MRNLQREDCQVRPRREDVEVLKVSSSVVHFVHRASFWVSAHLEIQTI